MPSPNRHKNISINFIGQMYQSLKSSIRKIKNLRINVQKLVYQRSETCIPVFQDLYTKVFELVYQRFQTSIPKIPNCGIPEYDPDFLSKSGVVLAITLI